MINKKNSLILHSKSRINGHRLQIMRAIQQIRQSIDQEIFNYTQIIESLKDYKKPRDVINNLMKKGDIIRVKKGLYVFGAIWRRKPLNLELSANLIYGPSVISSDYVLSAVGLIPEHVTTITSITSGRTRYFGTPIGKFSYHQMNKNLISFGIGIQKSDDCNFFIAQPLKALADKIWLDARFKPTSQKSYSEYLFDDLRIDRDVLSKYLDKKFIDELAKVYSSRKIKWFTQFLEKSLNQ